MLVFSSKLSVQRRGKFGSKCESYMTFGIVQIPIKQLMISGILKEPFHENQISGCMTFNFI